MIQHNFNECTYISNKMSSLVTLRFVYFVRNNREKRSVQIVPSGAHQMNMVNETDYSLKPIQ